MKNLIGKDWVDSSSGATVDVRNPATSEFIDTVPQSTVEDVNWAVKCAKEGQEVWAQMPIYERGNILLDFAKICEENKDELAETLCRETGKPINQALKEVSNLQISIPAFVEKAKHLYGTLIPSGLEKGQDKTLEFTYQEPLGVVACIIPYNFPCDSFGYKVPSALIMGNAVIINPSVWNPLTVTKLVEYLRRAGIPDGVVEVIHGVETAIVPALANHSDVHFINFTGSREMGKNVMVAASDNLTRTIMELGGNDAFILCSDGDVELAVDEAMLGRLTNAGQAAWASKRFIIHSSKKKAFINTLISRLRNVVVGNPLDNKTQVGCLINEGAARAVEEQVNLTIKEGARLLYGGRRSVAFFEPTIIDGVTKDMSIACDMEVLGPVFPIIEFDSLEEAIEIANQSKAGIGGAVFTSNMKTASRVARELEVGEVCINGTSFFRSFEMPVGGNKNSGFGKEGVMTTLHKMSKTKTVVLKDLLK